MQKTETQASDPSEATITEEVPLPKPKSSFSQKFLAILSHTRVCERPLFIAYKPCTFAIKGHSTRGIMELIQPGDILVRGFNGYLDKRFIPGTFTHVGFYLGNVSDIHLKQLAKLNLLIHLI